MKVLKLYAWEPSFEEKIVKIRNKEIRVLKSAAYLNAGTAFIWACAPFLVSSLCASCFLTSYLTSIVTVTVIGLLNY